MAKSKIAPEIKEQADAIVACFNTDTLKNKPYAHYVTTYRGIDEHPRTARFLHTRLPPLAIGVRMSVSG